jgi:glycine/D-amino acid oxidase-like deaminating enzyme
MDSSFKEGDNLLPDYDVIIIGAGIFGLATGNYILEEDPSINLLIIDKNSGPGMGNTAKSAAAFRVYFTSNTNFILANSSIDFYLDIQKKGIDLDIQMVGYLWLESEKDYDSKVDLLKEIRRRGVEVKEYNTSELRKILNINIEVSNTEFGKLLGLHDVYRGLFVPKAGFLSPDKLVNYYFNNVKRCGGQFLFNNEVVEILLEPPDKLGVPGEPFPWQDKVARGVRLASGTTISSNNVIVAAGAWTPLLLDKIGIDAHIKPKKRQIFSIKAVTDELRRLLLIKEFNGIGMPFTILPKPRIYIRPEFGEGAFWISYSDDIGRPFEFDEDPIPEEDFYINGIYQILINYFPQFLDLMPHSMWAGYYAYSTIDKQPVIFSNAGIIVVTGGSGSGIMKGDAIGRIAAALYFEKKYAELYGGYRFDTTALGFENRNIERERFVL